MLYNNNLYVRNYKVKYVYEPKDKIKYLKEILEISELGNEYMIALDK